MQSYLCMWLPLCNVLVLRQESTDLSLEDTCCVLCTGYMSVARLHIGARVYSWGYVVCWVHEDLHVALIGGFTADLYVVY